MDKEKQLVIKGGVLDYRRAENEVSIMSAKSILENLNKEKYQIKKKQTSGPIE